MQWVRTWGGDRPTYDSDAGQSIATTPDGRTVVTGHFAGELHLGPHRIRGQGGEDIFLVVFDEVGRLVFVKTWERVGDD